MPFSLLYKPDFIVILPCLPLYETDSALILACYEADAAAILLPQLRNSGTGAGRVPLCGLNTASPLPGSAVLNAQSRIQSAETEIRICFREAKHAAIAPSAGTTPTHLFQASF